MGVLREWAGWRNRELCFGGGVGSLFEGERVWGGKLRVGLSFRELWSKREGVGKAIEKL